MKTDAYRLRGALAAAGRELEQVKAAADKAIDGLQARIHTLETACKDLQQERTVLWKRCRRLESALKALKKRATEKAKTHPALFNLTYKGVYTAEARSLARMMVATGTAEAKVGTALQEVARILGIKIKRKMSKRTVQRTIFESGVAADIQLAYEMARAESKMTIIHINFSVLTSSIEITYSSDSTSHKHIEYES